MRSPPPRRAGGACVTGVETRAPRPSIRSEPGGLFGPTQRTGRAAGWKWRLPVGEAWRKVFSFLFCSRPILPTLLAPERDACARVCGSGEDALPSEQSWVCVLSRGTAWAPGAPGYPCAHLDAAWRAQLQQRDGVGLLCHCHPLLPLAVLKPTVAGGQSSCKLAEMPCFSL